MKNKGFTPLEIERKRKRSRFLTGFTLIELLVVVVVIGILAGMSFVMIQGVIDMARRARSKSFSKSIQLQLALNEVGVWRFDDNPLIPVISGVHDDSGWGNHGTLRLGDEGNTSLEVAWVQGVFGKALRFDGKDDRVLIHGSVSLDTPNALTMEAWVFDRGDGTIAATIVKDTYKTHARIFQLRRNTDNRAIWHVWSNTGVRSVLTPVDSWAINRWFHITGTARVVAGGIEVRLYKDGVFRGRELIGGTSIAVNTAEPIRIAHGGEFPFFKKQYIDEVRIYNRALEVFAIQERYVKGLESLLARGIITEEEFNNRIAEKEKNLVVK